jgi:5-methylcytosine-specific restriction endonuclease McrA
MRSHNFSRKQRAEIALRSSGCCELCGARLKVHEGEADHILAVELGGESVVSNGRWLCSPCHKDKTASDIRGIRKADRVKDKNSGAFLKSANPLPCGRSSPWKKRFDGSVVRRDA